MRIVMLGAIVTGLVILRTRLFFAPRAIIATPFIGTLFMFRLISYCFHSGKLKIKLPFFQRLSYFLLLPNLTFLIFPIIDYGQFANTYYSREAVAVYRRGLYRLTIGVALLMLYRILYFYFSVSPEEVINAPTFFGFIAVAYFLIIQIAGMLLISVGWITLFGYDLPALFYNFFLAHSFADLWRRINIYWRDFMKNIFYYPIYFRLRKKGEYFALATTGLLAFFISWMLHQYQLFWISGQISLRIQDGIYWMIMGTFITINVMIQYANAGKRTNETISDLRFFLNSGLRTSGIFIFAAVLFSIWNADSLATWFFLASKVFSGSASDYLLLAGGVVSLVIISGVIALAFRNRSPISEQTESRWFPVAAPVLLMCGIVFIILSRQLPADSRVAIVGEEIGEARVNSFDREILDEGYYGKMLETGGALSFRLHGFELMGDNNWGNADGAMHRTGDIFLRSFNPDTSVLHYDFHMTINHFGMRDRQYTLEKPARTVRWIFLGGSYVTGFGVESDQMFSELMETRLNDSLFAVDTNHLEIMNASCFGYGVIQQAALCRTRIQQYNADAVFYFSHPDENRYCAQMMSKFVILGTDLTGYPEIQNAITKASVTPTQSRPEIVERLLPYSEEVIKWAYATIADSCIRNGSTPVWVFLPTTTDEKTDMQYTRFSQLASNAGFTCINLSGVYGNNRLSLIQGGGLDTHPSEFAHKLIAARLTGELRKHPELFLSRRLGN